jgi:hypothetical protein
VVIAVVVVVGGITRTAASVELDILSEAELVRVRDYEERTKNRDTILEQLDRRIRSGS